MKAALMPHPLPARHIKQLTVLALMVLTLLAMTAPSASAHKGTQSYVFLKILSDRIAGRVDMRISDLNEIIGLNIPQRNGLADAAKHKSEITKYVGEHLSINLGDGPEAISFTNIEFFQEPGASSSYVIANFVTPKKDKAPPRSFEVTYDAIFHQKTDRDAWLLITSDWQGGTFKPKGDLTQVVVYAPGKATHTVNLKNGSWWSGFKGTIGLGTQHIRIGTDHIMFVITLLLPSVLVFRKKQWEPAANFRPTLLRVLKIATSFTVAHSLTLTLAGLDLVKLPSRLIEVIIAVSIGLSAAHNFRPVFANREWIIAFFFGLFHGFGFASLLGDLGLKADRRVPSLLGFNLGVEIGQVVLILLVFPTLFLLRNWKFYPLVLKVGSSGAMAVAVGWVIERLFGVNLHIARLLDPLVEYPTFVILLGGLFLVAVAINRLAIEPTKPTSTVLHS
jgi:HupE / UreJ protein